MKNLLMLFAALSLSACTVVNTTALPSSRQGKEIFVTAGDIPESHDVLGLVQVTRSGPLFFGTFDPAGTDLEAGFKEVLIPQIRAMGGDGAVRARFHMTQYTPVTRVVAAIFFFIPFPTEVTITAQVVKLKAQEAAGDVPAPHASR